jgi:repressor LexA
MAKNLTDKQQQILQFILDYIRSEGFPPSIREIGTSFEIGSLRGVTVHLDALERKGYISRANTPRSIKVVHPSLQASNRVAMLPVLGSIAAGQPIFMDEQIEDTLPVPSEMVRNVKDAFLLRVRGDSMIGDGIMPHDLVVIKPQKTANQNDIVAVFVEDSATVKRISYEKNGIRLISSNANYDPIPIETEQAAIIGKVIGLIRDYQNMLR